MNRLSKFAISKRPYAVDMNSLHRQHGGGWAVIAVWFRRRRGVTVACIGELWNYLSPPPANALEFVERHTDGRYGGDAIARWDGETLWAPEVPYSDVPAIQDRLQRMLDGYPATPASFDGWWTFQ